MGRDEERGMGGDGEGRWVGMGGCEGVRGMGGMGWGEGTWVGMGWDG
jgi:hypothetical protein